MNNSLFKPGIRLSQKFTIQDKELASSLFHNDINFVSTSSLVHRMEETTVNLLKENLPKNLITISVEINIKHTIKVKKDEEITCSVHLKFAEANQLFFDFAFFNTEKEIVAIGAHERKIVDKQQFSH